MNRNFTIDNITASHSDHPVIPAERRLECFFFPFVLGLFMLFSTGIRAQSFAGGSDRTGDSLYHLADSLFLGYETYSSYALFNQAALWYKQYEIPVGYTKCLIRIAEALMRMQQFPAAYQYIDSAEHVVNDSGLSEDTVSSDLKLTEGYYRNRLRDHRNALSALMKALEIRLSLGLEDYNLSRIYSSMGESYYYLGDLTKAYTFYKKSVDLRERLLEPGDIRLAAIYNGLGVVLMDYKGHYDEALEYLDKTVRIFEVNRGKNYPGLGAAYTNMGLIFEKKGDYPKALDHHRSALRIFENQSQDFTREIASIYNNIGLIHLAMEEYGQALEWFLNSLDLKIKTKTQDLSSAYNNIGESYRNLGNYVLADRYFTKAIASETEVGKNHIKLARYYLNHGMFSLNIMNDYTRGMDLFQEALHLCLKYLGEKHPVTARAYFNLGVYFEGRNQPDSALYYIQKSIISNLSDFHETDYHENPDEYQIPPDIDLLISLKKKADLAGSRYYRQKDLNDLRLSFSTQELAVSSIEKIRMSYQAEESKLILTQNEKSTFDGIIHDAIRLFEKTGDPYYRDKAFEYTEKSKSANLLAAIRTVEAEEFGGIPEVLLQQEMNLKTDLSSYKELVYEERMLENQDTTKINLWENYIFNLQNRIDSLIHSFEQDYSAYYSLKFNTDVTTHRELAETITPRDAILEYTVTDTLLISFLHTKNQFLVQKTRIDSLFHFYT
ncbi:MAG: tetratricopeptide repeat protein, partial [Bacteroidales bacterium]